MKRPSLHRKALAALSPRHGDTKSPPHAPRGGVAALTIGALGIVYGDIGTSPLYAMDQLFFGRAEAARTPADVLGGVSLVIWTITIIVAIKYAILVLRAQNDGEGGVFALYGLLHERKKRGTTHFAVVADAGGGTAVRRRHHHAGDQRPVRGRRTAGRDAGLGPTSSSRSRSGF